MTNSAPFSKKDPLIILLEDASVDISAGHVTRTATQSEMAQNAARINDGCGATKVAELMLSKARLADPKERQP